MTLADRLAKLASMHQQGLLNKAEYKQVKKALIEKVAIQYENTSSKQNKTPEFLNDYSQNNEPNKEFLPRQKHLANTGPSFSLILSSILIISVVFTALIIRGVHYQKPSEKAGSSSNHNFKETPIAPSPTKANNYKACSFNYQVIACRLDSISGGIRITWRDNKKMSYYGDLTNSSYLIDSLGGEWQYLDFDVGKSFSLTNPKNGNVIIWNGTYLEYGQYLGL